MDRADPGAWPLHGCAFRNHYMIIYYISLKLLPSSSSRCCLVLVVVGTLKPSSAHFFGGPVVAHMVLWPQDDIFLLSCVTAATKVVHDASRLPSPQEHHVFPLTLAGTLWVEAVLSGLVLAPLSSWLWHGWVEKTPSVPCHAGLPSSLRLSGPLQSFC